MVTRRRATRLCVGSSHMTARWGRRRSASDRSTGHPWWRSAIGVERSSLRSWRRRSPLKALTPGSSGRLPRDDRGRCRLDRRSPRSPRVGNPSPQPLPALALLGRAPNVPRIRGSVGNPPEPLRRRRPASPSSGGEDEWSGSASPGDVAFEAPARQRPSPSAAARPSRLKGSPHERLCAACSPHC